MSAIALPHRPSAGGRTARALRASLLGAALVTGGLLLGALGEEMAYGGRATRVVAIFAILLPVLIWKRPQYGPAVLLAPAVLFEQVGATAPDPGQQAAIAPIPLTAGTHLFSGIGSLHLEPVDLLVLMVTLVYLIKTDAGTRMVPRSHVSRALSLLAAAVVVWLVVGKLHHGDSREAYMEARPWVYLVSAYFLTAGLIRSRAALRSLMWTFMGTTAFKAVQCLYVYIKVRHTYPRPDSMVGHEAAYFFCLYTFIVAALWLFECPGRMRKVMTWLLPVVVAANLVNHRRAAWLMLGVGFVVLWVIGYKLLAQRRRLLRQVAAGVAVALAAYLPLFWDSAGTLGLPATAIRSAFDPSPRDASSDLYRKQEDANLIYNIKHDGILGAGFGVKIDYALPIVDISAGDPNIKWVPHNGVLYVVMRMGLVGSIIFWSVVGTGIIAGCRLARSGDREIAVIGAMTACMLVAYALEGATDQGFFFYRIAFVTGGLLGMAEAARALQRSARANRRSPYLIAARVDPAAVRPRTPTLVTDGAVGR